MITGEGDQRHVDLLLKEYGLEYGTNRCKATPWDKTTFLANNPLAGAYFTT